MYIRSLTVIGSYGHLLELCRRLRVFNFSLFTSRFTPEYHLVFSSPVIILP